MRLRTIQAGPAMQMPVFIVLFLAPVYVPLDLLAGWVEAVAHVNPFTALVEGGRDFISGQDFDVWLMFAIATGLGAAFLAWCRARRPPRGDGRRVSLTGHEHHGRSYPMTSTRPRELELPEFHLVPLGAQHNESDHAAWTSEHRAHPRDARLRVIGLAAGRGHVARRQPARAGDARARLSPSAPASRSPCSCRAPRRSSAASYIYPAEEGDGDAEVRSWVRADVAELDGALHRRGVALARPSAGRSSARSTPTEKRGLSEAEIDR
jgi:hypothetical protein